PEPLAQRWPARHYAALASMIAAEWPDAAIALTGAAADRALATEIAALSGQRLRNLCGDTTLADTLALLSQSAGIVTNDNGLQHLAAAFGRPQVAIYGATDPRISPPRSARARVEWLHLECSPCFARHCRHGHLNCLNELSPAAVLASLRQAMQFATRA
ncbi:MAG TPA: lipopolysaccharide heptosyltransferase II, partial [Burkholderiaceae bacterium]|nr:lipopolysaccharide heptosyltransferase II [Burkholderiaceae bacterium]